MNSGTNAIIVAAANYTSTNVTTTTMASSSVANNNSTSIITVTFLPALNTVENWAMVVSQIISICLLNFLLLLRLCWPARVKQMSASMVFLLIGHSIGNVSAFPYTLQRTLALWDPKNWLYLTFWLAVINGCYLVMSSYFTLSITFDRLIVISLPYGIPRLKLPQRAIRRASLTFTILFFLVLQITLILLYAQMIPLDQAAVLKCAPIACVSTPGSLQLQSAIKPVLGMFNLVISVFFLWKVKKLNNQSIKNRLVKFTAWAEIFMDIVPYIITQSFQMITGQSISNYAGPFRTLFNYAEVAFCAIYYTSVFVKWGAMPSIGGMFSSSKQPQQNLAQRIATSMASRNVVPVNNPHPMRTCIPLQNRTF